MFSKILIANRGEIAVRIIRACKEMGIESVAVYSDADAGALHVALADESYCIGGPQAQDSYLNETSIISAAIVSGAQAIHPGYGFLSENAHFARACRENGIAFIGPDADCMEKVGDKTCIKSIFAQAGLSSIPGTEILKNLKDACKQAEKIGYPVMLKARSGGGGRGIRLIENEDAMCQNYDIAVAESAAAFNDSALYLEKYVFPARHIEVQIVADEASNVVCLGERDCSIQRNHQKLIEESPSPGLDSATRDKLIASVTKAVKSISYVGVGTLEFLLDENKNYWFMEMNVRLQVEHTVTEMLTQIDMVKWQIRAAAGVFLDFEQNNISLRGSSIECRINALSTGTIELLHVPGGPFVRFDTFLTLGSSITPFYDSLLGKLIVYAHTREEAVRKMKAALCELVIQGVETNIEEQLEIVSDEKFMSGKYDLRFMESR